MLSVVALSVRSRVASPSSAVRETTDSEDPWDQHGKELSLAMAQAANGDLAGAAAAQRVRPPGLRHRGEDGGLRDGLGAGRRAAAPRRATLDEAEAVLALAGAVARRPRPPAHAR